MSKNTIKTRVLREGRDLRQWGRLARGRLTLHPTRCWSLNSLPQVLVLNKVIPRDVPEYWTTKAELCELQRTHPYFTPS